MANRQVAYYNDNDPKIAEWLRGLVRANLIMPGEVDQRSIEYVEPTNLLGFTRCHFFTGIAGWDYALQLAGWPEGRPVWTGSCPCQPLSCAGKRRGEQDERHLWPQFFHLIRECRPATIFGEQVASADGLEWLDGISLDLEEIGYAVGAADLPAASVGATHRRQRFFWVATLQLGDTNGTRLGTWRGSERCECGEAGQPVFAKGGEAGRVSHASGNGREQGTEVSPGRQSVAPDGRKVMRLGEPADPGLQPWNESATGDGHGGAVEPTGCRVVAVANTQCDGGRIDQPEQEPEGRASHRWPNPWAEYRIVQCRDIDKRTGKQALRRVPEYLNVKPIFQLLATRLSDTMVSGFARYCQQAKKRIVGHAEKTRTSTGETLRALWDIAYSENLSERRSGASMSVQGTSLLLTALCQLERELGYIIDSETSGIKHVSGSEVRTMRDDSDQAQAVARSPQGWEPEQQRSGELRDIVHQMSLASASLPEAQGIIEAAFGFPLSNRLPGRVVQLRGLGNAIVPQVAATFIRAFLDCKHEQNLP